MISRRLAGHTAPFPEAGEPLLCLKNAARFHVFNGGIYPLAADYRPGDREIHVLVDDQAVHIPRAAFMGFDANRPTFELEPVTSFDFGYCLTVHKAQGSEWPRVLLIDEYHAPEHRARWLYTGITRAAQSIVVAH